MDEPSVSRRIHIDALEYTRGGLRTREAVELTTSRHNRIVLVRPKLAPVPISAQNGFAHDRAFPLPATLALLWAYRPRISPLPLFEVPRGPKGTLQVFGHADPSGDEVHNKALSERRAAVVLALLQTDVEKMIQLAGSDGWTPWEYQVLLRVLGSNPGPTDGDPGEQTALAVEHFASRYRLGAFHPAAAPRVPELEGQAFDEPTIEALIDAFVHAHAPDLQGCTLHALRPSVGCSEFNVVALAGGSLNRRVALLSGLEDPHPENAPCTEGDASACAVVGEGSYGCMWYREHVAVEPVQAAALYDPRWLVRPDGSYFLSVLTNLPDETPVVFDVFGCDTPVPSTNPIDDLADRWSDSLTATSVGGVATTTWTPPEDFELDVENGPLPVFRVATDARDAHAWANHNDVVGVQLFDPKGRCFSGVVVSFDTPAGKKEVTTSADGVAWVREAEDAPVFVAVPQELLLPHPSETVMVARAQSVAELDTERGSTIPVQGGRVTRLCVLPPNSSPGYASCHFDEGSVYPADTIFALVRHAKDAFLAVSGARLALFGHVRASGTDDVDKALSERRARFVHAVLTADLDALVAVVDEDGWEETHYVALAHFLGHIGDQPMAVFGSFQWGYSAGHHLSLELGLGQGDIEATGKLDDPTKRGLLDAYLATVGASLPTEAFATTSCAGCASFNPAPEGDHPDRVTLVVFPPTLAPEMVPCRLGDPGACHVVEGEGCRFFVERISEISLQYRWLEDAPRDDEDVLYQGARVRVHQGQRVAGAVYRVPALVEDISYAFVPPETSPVPTPASISPRVHRTRPEDNAIDRGLRKSRKIRPDAIPDGNHVRPMSWADDGRTIDELLLDYWAVALRQLSRKKSELTREHMGAYRALVESALPSGTVVAMPEESTFDDYRSLGDSRFMELFLVSALVAGGQVLNPAQSERYESNPREFLFACNVYATDLVGLLPHGAWLPKVQFAHPKEVREDPSKAQTARITDVGPSGLNDFLVARLGVGAEDYGWRQVQGDPSTRSGRIAIRKEAQRLANRGNLVVFSAGTKKETGHVGVVVPDLAFLTNSEKKSIGGGKAPWGADDFETHQQRHAPFRSQAGGINGHGIRSGVLVLAEPGRFRNPGYFAYDPTVDKSRGTDVER